MTEAHLESIEEQPIAIGKIEQDSQSFTSRMHKIWEASKSDYQDSDRKIRKVAIGLSTLAMQGLDRARASVVFVPIIATDVLRHTHSPTEAAIAAGTAFGAWCLAVGGSANEALDEFPQTVLEFNESFPAVANFFEESLPGFNETDRKANIAKKIASTALTHLKRGFTVSGIGPTPYIGAAAAKGRSKAETHKLNMNASLDGGIVIGGVVLSLAEVIVKIADTNPQLAEHIQNDASNIKLWYGVAGAMMIQQYAGNKIKKIRGRKSGIAAEASNAGYNFEVRSLSPSDNIQKVLDLEQEVWDKNNYGSLSVYDKYLPQSRIFAAFDDQDECLGVTRLFDGSPHAPPFLLEMPIDSPEIEAELQAGCANGTIEELGIAALAENAPQIQVTKELWRQAWRDSAERGITAWGIIMEPERVAIMRKRYGFPFRQVGPAIDYQGGDCAAHVMSFEDVHTEMKTNRPEYYEWFVQQPL